MKNLLPSAICLSFTLAVNTLTGCTQLEPYHTEWAASGRTPPDCAPDPQTDQVPPACQHLVVERVAATGVHDPGYSLYFAEFDDQGWPYDSPKYGAAGQQIAIFTKGLEEALTRNSGHGVSVITYVHGWKHNAGARDDNVVRFRQVLRGLGHIEAESPCQRKVIGLYVGWRGASLEPTLPDALQNTTFWDRKNTAVKMAQGSVRELFARIRAIQSDPAFLPKTRTGNTCVDHPLRSMIIGHSFGGLIVFTVLSEALIRDITDFQRDTTRSVPDQEQAPPLAREGDLVMIINPAIEASRYDALARAVNSVHYPSYKAPLFVSLTSVNDWATRYAFPAGRAFSTLFQKYTPELKTLEQPADRQTIGHDEHYLTMELQTLAAYNESHACGLPPAAPSPGCLDYVGPKTGDKTDSKETAWKTLTDHLKQEAGNFEDFRARLDASNGNAAKLYPRHFCGQEEMVLSLWSKCPANETASRLDANSPLWNIRTQKPIIVDHGDITNPYVFQFVRQLYLESDDQLLRALQPNAPR